MADERRTVRPAPQANAQHVPAHPGSSSLAASRRMSAARRRDTGPEVRLRRTLFARGLRYRVAFPVPGQRRRTIDIAFTRAKVAVFIDGCFWHGCPAHGTSPRANSEWWSVKLRANQDRDRDTDRLLTELGWTVVRVWEHESTTAAARRIAAELGSCVTAPPPVSGYPADVPTAAGTSGARPHGSVAQVREG